MPEAPRPAAVPRPAAAVIPLRVRQPGPGLEVLLLRRHRRATFMANAFVFPGGQIDPADASPEAAAVRELFEEAGVLLADRPLEPERQAAWRRRLLRGEATFADLLAEERLTPAHGRLHYWARWITPSLEPKRFDARFFLAELPAGAEPSFDAQETVEQAWLTPAEALVRQAAGSLPLPPPQLRTLIELAAVAERGMAALLEAAALRRAHSRAVMPRFARDADPLTILFPWDPEYETRGLGEGEAIPPDHLLAGGPSRVVLAGTTWRPAFAPSAQAG